MYVKFAMNFTHFNMSNFNRGVFNIFLNTTLIKSYIFKLIQLFIGTENNHVTFKNIYNMLYT